MKALLKRQRMDRKIVEQLRQGVGTNEISRTLRVSKKRVVEVRKRAGSKGYLDERVSLPPYPEVLFPEVKDGRKERAVRTDNELLPYKEWIQEKLELGWYPITVWEELPVKVPRSNFYRFINRHRLRLLGRHYRVVPEIISEPGEVLQLDWGKLRTVKEDGKKRTLYMLIGVLGYSRKMMVRLVWKADVETTLIAIKSMFEELGGVPRKLTTDNPKCISILADRYEALLNPVAERFAAYYGCIIECLAPRQPQKKGKVERQMPYVRRLYQAHGEDWWGLEESQNYLNGKLLIANKRKHGTTGLHPEEVFEKEEKQAFKHLPVEPYEIEEYHKGVVRKDGCIRFRGKYYAVTEEYVGKEVVVIGNSSQVSIYCAGNLIEVHDRITNPHQSKSIKPHHKKPWERTFNEHSVYRKRARALGGWVEELVIAILGEGNGFIDFRKIWGILSLDKKFSSEIIDQACQIAFEQERLSYRAVKDYAERLSAMADIGNQPEQQKLKVSSAKFTRDISQYSNFIQLSLIKGGAHE